MTIFNDSWGPVGISKNTLKNGIFRGQLCWGEIDPKNCKNRPGKMLKKRPRKMSKNHPKKLQKIDPKKCKKIDPKNVKIWAKKWPKKCKKMAIFSIFSILRGKCRISLKYFRKNRKNKAENAEIWGPDPEKMWTEGFSHVY